MDKQRARSARIVVAGALALALAGISAPVQVTPDGGDLRGSGAFAWSEIAFAQGNSDNSNAGGNGRGQGDGSGNSSERGNAGGDDDGGSSSSPDQSNAGGSGTDQGGGDGTARGHGGGNSSDGRGGGDQTNEPQQEMGPSLHPSGKDRTVEPGGSGTQGRSPSDPDGDFNYGPDKPGERGGIYTGDQDGNNGCGNDQDFEDDNRGNCGGLGRGGDSPGGEQPGGEQPGGEEPGGEQPGGEQPAGNTPGGIVGGIDGGTDSGGNPSNGGNRSNGGGGNGNGGNSVPGINASTPIGITDSFTAVQAQSLSVAANEDESVDLTPSINDLSVEPARSMVDVPAPAVDVPEPSAGIAAPIAGTGAAVGDPVVAALPATGIGAGSLSSSAGSLLMLMASGLSALGALGARRCWGQSR
jgi:hypothetical protein